MGGGWALWVRGQVERVVRVRRLGDEPVPQAGVKGAAKAAIDVFAAAVEAAGKPWAAARDC